MSDDDTIQERIAHEIRVNRERLGWSLADLAERSGVSKAMIHQVEQGRANPTAVLLGRLCSGLGTTLSALIAAVEAVEVVVWRAEDQPVLDLPADGMLRRSVGVPLAGGGFDITRVCLDPDADIVYDVPPRFGFHQYIVVLSGQLRFTAGSDTLELAEGDCLGIFLDRPNRFQVGGGAPVEYLVIAERGDARAR